MYPQGKRLPAPGKGGGGCRRRGRNLVSSIQKSLVKKEEKEKPGSQKGREIISPLRKRSDLCGGLHLFSRKSEKMKSVNDRGL